MIFFACMRSRHSSSSCHIMRGEGGDERTGNREGTAMRIKNPWAQQRFFLACLMCGKFSTLRKGAGRLFVPTLVLSHEMGKLLRVLIYLPNVID